MFTNVNISSSDISDSESAQVTVKCCRTTSQLSIYDIYCLIKNNCPRDLTSNIIWQMYQMMFLRPENLQINTNSKRNSFNGCYDQNAI